MYGLALVVVAVAYFAVQAIVRELKASRDDARRGRALQIMALFAPALASARKDPRELLAWQPLAKTARQLWPDDFALLDRTTGGTFPFSADFIQAIHSQWTADWLAWELTHDAEYKVKVAEAANDRLKLEAVEREKLDRYQRRYQEYVQVGKALHALVG